MNILHDIRTSFSYHDNFISRYKYVRIILVVIKRTYSLKIEEAATLDMIKQKKRKLSKEKST